MENRFRQNVQQEEIARSLNCSSDIVNSSSKTTAGMLSYPELDPSVKTRNQQLWDCWRWFSVLKFREVDMAKKRKQNRKPKRNRYFRETAHGNDCHLSWDSVLTAGSRYGEQCSVGIVSKPWEVSGRCWECTVEGERPRRPAEQPEPQGLLVCAYTHASEPLILRPSASLLGVSTQRVTYTGVPGLLFLNQNIH